MVMEDRDIKSLTREELRKELLDRGEKAFRADQIYGWMHQRLAEGNILTEVGNQFRLRFGCTGGVALTSTRTCTTTAAS